MNLSSITLGDLRAMQSDTSLSDAAQKRVEWFVYALKHDGSVEEACRHFSISQSTFMRWLKRFDVHDPSSLEEKSRRPHRVREPEVDSNVIEHIKHYREQFPTMGKKRIATLLKAEHGVSISPSSVGRVINRYGFYFGDTLLHRRKRRAAQAEETIEQTYTASGRSFHPQPA